MKKNSSLKRLFEYAGGYKYLTMASWVFSVISAWIALIPFYYIWKIIKEVLEVMPEFDQATNLSRNGWCAVGFAVLAMFIYICGLMCSHMAAFHVQANMRSQTMRHILTLPMGFMDGVVKTFGQSVFSFKRFKESIENYEKWVISYTKDLRMPMVLYTTVINAVFAALIAAAIAFTSSGITNTFLLNLIFYIIITPIITVTLNKIMYSSENAMIVEDAIARIDGIMNMKPLKETENPMHPKDASITFENVSFHYAGAKENAVHRVSFSIDAGECVAFVGPSGGGKTTLASLLARFWDVTEGKIRIGGVDVRDIAGAELMNTVSFVFQDSKLLKMSIYDNIRMSKPEASREEVMQALKEAQCEDIIAKMPNGIDTMYGSGGTYVSGGEAQRLSIARAFLKNAPIILLDEATASLDVDNETLIQESLSRLIQNKTVLIIAHRMRTIAAASKIVVLKDGIVAEQGSPEELQRKNGIYQHMLQMQMKAEQWKF